MAREALKQSADTHDLVEIEKCQTIQLARQVGFVNWVDKSGNQLRYLLAQQQIDTRNI